MITNLNTKHGMEVWINQKLSEEIEKEFKAVLETDELYYYYIPCNCEKKKKNEDSKSNVKWIGKISLIEFIKKVQSVDSHFCPIGVTNAKNKKSLLYYFNNDFNNWKREEVKHWDYWIGDAVQQKMVCGDELFIELWNRVRDKVTKNAKTKKSPFK
jgi:hypothetical protein